METTTKPILLDNAENADAFFICGDGTPQPKNLSPEELRRAIEEECAPAGPASPTPALAELFEQRRRNKTRSKFGK
jgi:hypothetical protein